MGLAKDLPQTGYIKMVDVWMIFTISYPFLQILMHSLKEVLEIELFNFLVITILDLCYWDSSNSSPKNCL